MNFSGEFSCFSEGLSDFHLLSFSLINLFHFSINTFIFRPASWCTTFKADHDGRLMAKLQTVCLINWLWFRFLPEFWILLSTGTFLIGKIAFIKIRSWSCVLICGFFFQVANMHINYCNKIFQKKICKGNVLEEGNEKWFN